MSRALARPHSASGSQAEPNPPSMIDRISLAMQACPAGDPRAMARAAIQEMRKPDARMLKAAMEAAGSGLLLSEWRAMIDAAGEEGGSSQDLSPPTNAASPSAPPREVRT